MEALAEFLPLVLFVVYAILRGLRGRKTPQQAPTGTQLAESEDPMAQQQPQTDLDELARHLETLLTGAPPPQPKPKPVPAPRYEPEFRNSEAPVNEAASFQHQQHGFGAENPLSEEVFERQPAFVRPARTAHSDPTKPVFDPHNLKRSSKTPERPVSPWKKRLADPKRAREAFVLQTILERPGERKR